jgi:hypothetical protein
MGWSRTRGEDKLEAMLGAAVQEYVDAAPAQRQSIAEAQRPGPGGDRPVA